MNIDVLIAQYLEEQGIGKYKKAGQSIFTCPMQESNEHIPAKSIWILLRPGKTPDYEYGHRSVIYNAMIQILVRYNPGTSTGNYEASRDYAKTIYESLNGKTPAGMWPILPMQSEPCFIEYDLSSRPIWSINLYCRYEKGE